MCSGEEGTEEFIKTNIWFSLGEEFAFHIYDEGKHSWFFGAGVNVNYFYANRKRRECNCLSGGNYILTFLGGNLFLEYEFTPKVDALFIRFDAGFELARPSSVLSLSIASNLVLVPSYS